MSVTRRRIALALALGVGVIIARLLPPSRPGAFSFPPVDATHIDLDRSVLVREVEDLACRLAAAGDSPLTFVASSRGNVSEPLQPDLWWASLPRTGDDVYHAFVVNPAVITATQLLRNETLNPLDLEVPRADADGLVSWYANQVLVAKQARGMVNSARRSLAFALDKAGRLPVYTPSTLASMTFDRQGVAVSGEQLVGAARARRGDGASDATLAIDVLMSLGQCGPGSTVKLRGGQVMLMPANVDNAEVKYLLEIERGIVLSMVGTVHNWFTAQGLVGSGELLLRAASIIEESPR